ncbi:hypothetical protein FRC16_001167 [Serendipita sp. 398]|nr:hypothetical protein FRC16_001167 [Serendipita sp. 398]
MIPDHSLRICADRGGTFCDIHASYPDPECEGSRKELVVKLLSQDPANYRDAPTEGIRRILETVTGQKIERGTRLPTNKIDYIRLSTTVATNALLERKGKKHALVITKGFKDLLLIGNQSRPRIFDLNIKRPDPLYTDVIEVDERVTLVGYTSDPAAADHAVQFDDNGKITKGYSGESSICGIDANDIIRLATFGGAGGQHAGEIARLLGIKTVLIHRYSSILSAYGLSLADRIYELQEPSSAQYTNESHSSLIRRLDSMEEKARAALRDQGFPDDRIQAERYLNMRFDGTDTSLMILGPSDGSHDFEAAFKNQHKEEFGFLLEGKTIMVDDFKVRGLGKTFDTLGDTVHEELKTLNKRNVEKSKLAHSVFFDGVGRVEDTPVYELPSLKVGDVVEGPAMIIDDTQTIVVIPKSSAIVASRHLSLPSCAAVYGIGMGGRLCDVPEKRPAPLKKARVLSLMTLRQSPTLTLPLTHQQKPKSIMLARFATVALLALSTLTGIVQAEPVPFPAPTAAPPMLQEKRDIFDSIAAGASSVFAGVTAAGGGVASFVTSVGGQGVTLISEEGGSVYTLATDGVGQVTTIAGQQYTIATNAYVQATSSAGSPNAASTRSSFPITLSLVGTIAGVIMGAAFVL